MMLFSKRYVFAIALYVGHHASTTPPSLTRPDRSVTTAWRASSGWSSAFDFNGVTTVSPDYEYVLTAYAYNANEAPLSHIVLEGNAEGTNLTQEWFNVGDGGFPEPVQHGITYRDAGGRYFVRNLATGKYLSARCARIWQKRH